VRCTTVHFLPLANCNQRAVTDCVAFVVPPLLPCSIVLISPWSGGKCVRFGAGRLRVQLLAGSYQDHVNWYCSLLTRRTVCGRAAGNTPRTQKQTELNETRNCTKSVVALHDHCSYKAPTTNHHIKISMVLAGVVKGCVSL